MSDTSSILKTIQFSEFSLWDVKRFLANQIESNYPIVRLGDYIKQRSQKIKLNDFPEQSFGILGVSNQVGIFDAYTEKGKNINQPYQEVNLNDLAYNPYRINVGSIGLKTSQQSNSYISPAYVVFECQKGLEADFLFKMFKTETFNQIIRDNTTGSVRQNLTFDMLENFKAPLPTLDEQNRLIDSYNKKIALAKQLETQALALEQSIEEYLDKQLGIKKPEAKKTTCLLSTVSFKNLDKWGFDFQNNSEVIYSKNYEVSQIHKICSVGSGGTPSRTNKEYYKGDIPWIKTGEVINDVITDTEEKITKEAIENSSARLFSEGSLIIAMYGQGKTRGRTAKLGIESSTNQACAVLFDINENIVLTDYLWIYLMNEYERLREMASGNNQPNLNAQMIKTYPLVIPPIDIQKQIISYFFTQRKEIKLLREQAKQNRQNALSDFEKEIFKA